jgi:ubiquinol-cytochrome c reductase cytochrome b subunit
MSIADKSIADHADLVFPHPSRRGWVQRASTWLDARTGLVSASRSLFHWQVPTYVERNLLYALGGLTLISLLIQFFTGFCLSFYYDPSSQDAYNSVDYITYQAPLGWLIRGIHHYNASAIVILVFLHTCRTFFFSAYKRPRELTWLSGVGLLLVTLGFGFTGYLLPWDQKGYWATQVSTHIASQTPLIGDTVASLLRGGATLGQLTLTRFYVIHVALLPALLCALTLLHLQQHRRHGVAPSLRPHKDADGRTVPYFPNWVVMDALLGLGLLALLVYLSWTMRAPLEFPANPASTDYDPRPEWYFLFLFRMLHITPGALTPLVVIVAPLVVIGSMLLLPFVDTSEERRPWRKPVTTLVALCYIAVIIVFTIWDVG